jgi:four helix bundle protein
MQTNKGKNAIVEISFEFALQIIKYTAKLERSGQWMIAKQLLKSGTSIGANVRESQNAESRADFIHKMKIAAKENDETEYWLLLCKNSEGYANCDDLICMSTSISKILSKIIGTTKRTMI